MRTHDSQHRLSRFLLGPLLFLLSLSGCGAILHGKNQEVTFDSKPPGAIVKLDNAVQFLTPHTVALSRASNHQATFDKDGYEPQQIAIKHQFLLGPSIIGNILPIFPIGLAIDIMTGAAWGFEQEYIAIDLTKAKVHP